MLLIRIYGIMKDFLPKIRSKVCHACRVNHLKEYVAGMSWHVCGPEEGHFKKRREMQGSSQKMAMIVG